jgi:hypothetical protein
LAVATGFDPKLIREYCAEGVLNPARRGSKGRGCTHHFSLAQAIALTYGGRIRQVYAGVRDVADITIMSVARMTLEEILTQCRSGETLLMSMPLADATAPAFSCWVKPPYGTPEMLLLDDTFAEVLFKLKPIIAGRNARTEHPLGWAEDRAEWLKELEALEEYVAHKAKAKAKSQGDGAVRQEASAAH